MLVGFEFLVHVLSMLLARLLIVLSNKEISSKFDMFKFLIEFITTLINNSSFTLSLLIALLHKLITSSDIGIMIVRGA